MKWGQLRRNPPQKHLPHFRSLPLSGDWLSCGFPSWPSVVANSSEEAGGGGGGGGREMQPPFSLLLPFVRALRRKSHRVCFPPSPARSITFARFRTLGGSGRERAREGREGERGALLAPLGSLSLSTPRVLPLVGQLTGTKPPRFPPTPFSPAGSGEKEDEEEKPLPLTRALPPLIK